MYSQEEGAPAPTIPYWWGYVGFFLGRVAVTKTCCWLPVCVWGEQNVFDIFRKEFQVIHCVNRGRDGYEICQVYLIAAF